MLKSAAVRRQHGYCDNESRCSYTAALAQSARLSAALMESSLPNGAVPLADCTSVQYTSSTWLLSVFDTCTFYLPLVQRWAAKRWRSRSTDARVCRMLEFTNVLLWSQFDSINTQCVCIAAQQFVIMVIDVIAKITVMRLLPCFAGAYYKRWLRLPSMCRHQASLLCFFFFFISFPFALSWPKASGPSPKLASFFRLFCGSFPPNFCPKFNKCIWITGIPVVPILYLIFFFYQLSSK